MRYREESSSSTHSTRAVARGWGRGSWHLMRTEFQLGMMKKFWRWMLGIGAQWCNCTWFHSPVHLNMTVVAQLQSQVQLWDPMDCSMPGFPVHHHLLEFAQIHVHWVGDATKPSHPLLSPSPPSFGLSQHQGLFLGISSSHQVAKVLEPQLQHQSFQWIYRVDFLYDWPVWAPCCPRNSEDSSPAPQF